MDSKSLIHMGVVIVAQLQCDQICQFIGLWATFKSLWQQLICPNLPHSWAIFVMVLKSFIFLVKSLLGNFSRHLAIFFWSHCSVGRVFNSHTRGLQFKFSHWQNLYWTFFLSTVLKRRKIKKKRPWVDHLLYLRKNHFMADLLFDWFGIVVSSKSVVNWTWNKVAEAVLSKTEGQSYRYTSPYEVSEYSMVMYWNFQPPFVL